MGRSDEFKEVWRSHVLEEIHRHCGLRSSACEYLICSGSGDIGSTFPQPQADSSTTRWTPQHRRECNHVRSRIRYPKLSGTRKCGIGFQSDALGVVELKITKWKIGDRVLSEGYIR